MSAVLAETRPDEAPAVVEAPRRERKRVVIGDGFAEIAAAHALRHADAEVVLIDHRNTTWTRARQVDDRLTGSLMSSQEAAQ